MHVSELVAGKQYASPYGEEVFIFLRIDNDALIFEGAEGELSFSQASAELLEAR